MSADELVQKYVELRDARDELKRRYTEHDTILTDQMEEVATELKEMCKTIGADSISTSHGTATRLVRTRYWTGDWDSIKRFVRDNDAFDLLERRIHQSNMKQWLEEHPDKLPSGLNIDSKYDIVVRRKQNG